MIHRMLASAPQLAVGVLFVAIGAALLADRLGLVPFGLVLTYWPMALVLLGLSLVAQALSGPPPAGVKREFPAGTLILLVLVTIVLSHTLSPATSRVPGVEDDVRLPSVLSGRTAAITGDFRAADITSVMGGSVLDLRQATIPPGEQGVVDLFTVMGGVELYVPRNWTVDVQSTVIMGGVEDERTSWRLLRPRNRRRPGRSWREDDVNLPPAPATTAFEPPDAPADETGSPARLVVRGFVMMGGVTIKP